MRLKYALYCFSLSPVYGVAISQQHRPANLSCGDTSSRTCANNTAAQAPIKVRHQEYVVNEVQWNQWPTLLTLESCLRQCNVTKGCRSVNYNYIPSNSYEPGLWSCNIIFHSVSSYKSTIRATEKCDHDGLVPLDAYFDKNCPIPKPYKSGTIPQNPSTDPVNGTCNTIRQPGNMPQLYADQLGSQFGRSQHECAKFCRDNGNCKSYYFVPNLLGDFQLPDRSSTHYYPTNSTNVVDPRNQATSNCVLMSQPVKKYTTHTGYAAVTGFYDLNCPLKS